MEYLFSYGTLQKNEVQVELFGRQLDGAVDSLEDHKTVAIEITDEAFLSKGEERWQLTVVASRGDVINGTVFEISAAELGIADLYEPVGFRRIVVTLASGKTAWLYLAA